jgi:hypothetical protein
MPINIPGLSPAGAELGLGGALADQVAGETEEQRRRRMAQIAAQRQTGMNMSPAGMELFGGMNSRALPRMYGGNA